jgi:PPK2 family polyphosphate:nucleotide phosphotransferase
MTKYQRKGAVRDILRAGEGSELPRPDSFPLGPGKKAAARKELLGAGERLEDLQEALYAEGAAGGGRSVLLVLQGMDTSGKGGTVRHVLGLVNPMGVQYEGFKKPTPAERRHHYLWRVRKKLPTPGHIGVFDRSHYEDILVPRVQGLLTEDEQARRFEEINEFEQELVDGGMTIVKAFLHISPEAQYKRLKARLGDPTKWWKYDPSDLEARSRWADYQAAYLDVLRETSTDAAPWYVVPSDRKWYRNWVVAELLTETMKELAPVFPEAHIDVKAELKKLKGVGVPV